ncbi:MAG TPA: UDP-N-acetylmuramate dehydrogenase [Bacillota bacterium]|nr:UDP-N-acetylmuramate dehydrogenase [Bacillota bacterium]
MKKFLSHPIAQYSSFNIGKTAKEVYLPETREELIELIKRLDGEGRRRIVLGNASNVVFPDCELDAALIFTGELSDIMIYSDIIAADCGASLSRVAITACRAGLSGAEFMYGIPGSVGGAVTMNAGAYGGEVADILCSATVFTDGRIREMTNANMCFGKRSSMLQTTNGVLISARFLLCEKDSTAIQEKMDANMEQRKNKQPLSYPSAGSVFKRPEGHYAGALIEQAGLKGYSVGGAMVSEKHAGFIINTGVATQSDVKKLVNHIKETVLHDSGIELECEIKFIDN